MGDAISKSCEIQQDVEGGIPSFKKTKMKDLIKEFKEDKILRLSVYITLISVIFVVTTLLINPIILIYTILTFAGGLLIMLFACLIYALLDDIINTNR